MSLTDAERRGARWLALLFVLGTVSDIHRSCHPVLMPVVAPVSARDTVTAAPGRASPGASANSAPDSPLDLNHASVADLDRLPGIGPVLAKRIVEHREQHGSFRSVDELLGVPGIGVRSLERLRPHVVVTPR